MNVKKTNPRTPPRFFFRNAITLAAILFFSDPVDIRAQHFNAIESEHENLILNGGFEEGVYSQTSRPDNWESDGEHPGAAEFFWDDTEARTGSRSVKIEAQEPNDTAWLQTVAVEPDTLYFLAGWIKTQQVTHTEEMVDAGANLSIFGTYTRSDGRFETRHWRRSTLLFNSGENSEVTVAARLGYWYGPAAGAAWFDDIRLAPVVPMNPPPSWKILLLIYRETDFEVTDETGIYHHYVAAMTSDEIAQAVAAAKAFVETDIPALTDGSMIPELRVRIPDRSLDRLTPLNGGYWPSPEDTAEERDPRFDSVMVIWDPRAFDLQTNSSKWIGYADGLSQDRGTSQTYLSMQIDAAVKRGHRNVFKHEWGHSILYFFEAAGTAPWPAVNNHAQVEDYVNCETGLSYIWENETLDHPIPDSIYNNTSGFTHDYYSGKIATADQPTRCLGIPPQAWAYGGPVSHSGNPNELPARFSVYQDPESRQLGNRMER